MANTVAGFTAEDWRTILQGLGSCLTAVIGAAGLAYARLAVKRATAAKTAAEDATEAGGRAEVAAAGGTSDLSAEVAELRALVLQRTGPVAAQRTALQASLDSAARMVARRGEAAPPETPSGAPETPQETPEGAGPDEGAETLTGAPEGRDGAAAAPSLDTQAVWQLLGHRPK